MGTIRAGKPEEECRQTPNPPAGPTPPGISRSGFGRPASTPRSALAGELDIAAAPEVTTLMQGVAEGSTAVMLDIEAVTFMDSAGLRCVLLCERLCRDAGVAFSLTRGPRGYDGCSRSRACSTGCPPSDEGPGAGG